MCQILTDHCIVRGEKVKPHTHTWFGSGKFVRKVSMQKDAIDKLHLRLFQLIKGQLPHNICKWNAISEKIPANDVFRYFADIDFSPKILSIQPDFDLLKDDMQCLLDLFKTVVEACCDKPVTEWYVATRMYYKYHLHFPTIIVNSTTAKHINELFRQKFSEHETLSKYYTPDAVDSSVYKTGLRMLWCHKGNMIKQDKLDEKIKEHIAIFGDKQLYEHCYYLIDPDTMLPLLLDLSHLKHTSILTDSERNCFYENPRVTTGTLVSKGITEKNSKDNKERTAKIVKDTHKIQDADQWEVLHDDNDVNSQKVTSEDLTEETQEIVKNEISTRFDCYSPNDVNKILDFENYLIAAISKTTCPLKGGDHSKNHPYVVICQNGLKLKCHNNRCKTIFSEWYPISVELEMALDEHGKRLIPYAEGYLVKNMLKQIYIPQWTEDLQSAFTAYLNNYVAMFLPEHGGVSYLYRKTPEMPWCLYSKERVREILNKFNTHVSYVSEGVQKVHHIRIFETWMTNINRREITKVIMDPSYMGDDPEHPEIWNAWGGFDVQPEKIVNQELIQPVLDHILEVYCSGDQKKYDCFINWLTHLVKEPAKKIGTAIILKGPQGTGKNIILDWFGRNVIGSRHYHEYNSMEDLLNRFNSDSEYKVFCICNEISNWGGCMKTNDILKNRITNQRTRIEKKGIDAINGEDFQNFIFTTNNDWVVRITADDRRYIVLETSDKYKGDAEYFSNLAECLNKVETAEHFLGYLFNKSMNCVCRGKFISDPDAPLINVHEAIWTEEKKDLMNMSKESITDFVDMVADGKVHFLHQTVSQDGSIVITNAELYRAYCDYHDVHNFATRKLDVQKFGIALKKEICRYSENIKRKVFGPKDARIRGWALKYITHDKPRESYTQEKVDTSQQDHFEQPK